MIRARSRSSAPVYVGSLLAFLELQIPMVLGAGVCFLLGRLIRASSVDASGYHAGTLLYFAGDLFFLVVPVMAWTIVRRGGWRHGLALSAAMLAPVTVIVAVGELARFDYLMWLVNAMYPAMSLGVLAYVGLVALSRPAEVGGLEPRDERHL